MKTRSILVMAGIIVALGVAFYFSSRPKPAPAEKPRPFIWSVQMADLWEMSISLPRKGMSESWIKHDDQYWYFDKPAGPKVDMNRWGGGVPLLLSGPGADRLIADNATDEQLKVFGLAAPEMRIRLALEDKSTIAVDVGDATPDGQAYYIKVADSKKVYTVDYTWHDVLQRLVLDPPYPGQTGR